MSRRTSPCFPDVNRVNFKPAQGSVSNTPTISGDLFTSLLLHIRPTVSHKQRVRKPSGSQLLGFKDSAS